MLALGAFGAFFPYASWYLSRTLGMSGSSVGLTMAMLPLVGLVAQPTWGQIADRTGRRTRVLTGIIAGTAVGYAVTGSAEGAATVTMAMAFHALFGAALVPNLWAVTMALLAARGLRYVGWARVAGTVGFVVVAFLFPLVVNVALDGATGAEPSGLLTRSAHADGRGVRLLFPIAASFAALAAVAAASLPRSGEVTQRARKGETRALLADPAFRRLVGVTFLTFFCMQGPMALFPLLVHAQGGGLRAIGQMWVLMIALEVPLVAGFGWTVRRLGIERVILVGVAAGATRWLVSGYTGNLDVAVAAQVLHGVTVWGVVLGIPAMVDGVVPPTLRSTAQSLVAMLGVGVGGLASSVASGLLVDAFDARAPARIGGLGALALAMALPWLLPRRVPAGPAELRP
jgi:PPP family 3-phenylpropionic acid transporter